ncbi:hypothetical protein TNCV_2355121 [Trichonephila clavipes]|nr:hypothetical protein TNCV_2355121 [Trichonephila clavipes]
MNRRLEPIGLYARRLLKCVPLTATHCLYWLDWSIEHAVCVDIVTVGMCDVFRLVYIHVELLNEERQIPVTSKQ